MEEALRRREAILRAVSSAAERFLRETSFEKAKIQEVLAHLCQPATVSRVYVFENHVGEDGTHLASQRYEWVGTGIMSQVDNPDVQDFPWQAGGMSRWEKRLRQGQIIQDHVREFPASEQKILAPQNIQSIVVVPIFLEEKWWGFIGFDECQKEREWYAAEIDALKIGGAILGALIERKQAEEALRESETQKKAILDASIDRIRLTDIDGRIIWANQTHTRDLNVAPEELVGKVCYEVFIGRDSPCSECPAQKALTTGKIEHSVLVRPQADIEGGKKYLDSYAVPIKNKSGEIVNIMRITRDISERKQAEEELKRSQKELRNLADHLQSVREQERTTIAREIHDELAQALTALKMDIAWLDKKLPKDQETLREKTRAMTELTDITIKTVKKISTELRPGLLDDLGLVAAIEWQAEEFQNRTGITCRLDVDPEDIMVEEKRSTTLFRIFQETLTNIARHAHATAVTVSLKEKDSSFELRVRDNGKGITKEQISDPKSFGLIGMRERVHPWKGEVKISGRSGKGTTVVVRIPVEEISRKGAKDAEKK